MEDGKRALELPLNGRNVLQLGLLVPGVVSAGSGLPGNAKSPADNQDNLTNGDFSELLLPRRRIAVLR